MTTKRTLENINITPGGDSRPTVSPATPRSRKCLVLSPRPPASPLAERQNLPSSLRTPTSRHSSQFPDSPLSSPRCLPFSEPPSPSASESSNDEQVPSLFPKRDPDSTPTISASSFYSSGSKTPQPSVSSKVFSTSKSARSSKRAVGSLKRHRTRSVGGVKRKRSGLGFGGGHAIKKPKLTPKPDKPVKISDLPVGVSVDLPAACSSYKAAKTPAKTSGQLSMSASTKVEFEVKGGHFVFRARAKTSTTPLRRSPRKHMSPLKADYFSESKRGKSRERNKLFSAAEDFMRPSCSPEEAVLPSPVKFVAEGDGGEDLSDLITSLAQAQAIDVKAPVPELPQASFTTSSTNPELPDVTSAVNDILNDLSSGDESQESLPGLGEVTESEESEAEAGKDKGAKLFPIFYNPPSLPSSESGGTGGAARKFICSSLSSNQAQLDLGQKVLGAVQCPTCGAVYTVGDPQEEQSHNRIHQGRLDTLRFPGWKSERKVGDFPAGRVLCVKPGDHASHWKKVTEILTVVDADLGFSEVGIRWPDKTKVFLYVAEKRVVGLLLAERIEKGFRILPNNDSETSGKVYCCSETPESVMCGISRIWVLSDFRRGKVASSLVDCMRSNFYQNHFLAQDQFAFSDPTMDGIKFASKYMKTQEFLVYSR